MNERIKAFAEQAQQYAEYTTPQGLEWLDTFKAKFAELIVKECAEVADNADATRSKWESVGKYVREHFGVE